MSQILRIYRHFSEDSLYRNSIYLMLSTAVMAFFGFFFWIINARLYTSEEIGIATTLISIMSLISAFSTLGLDVGLVRFLPKSEEKNKKINSSFLITSVASILISIVFLVGLDKFSPKLLFLNSNIMYTVTFIIFIVSLSINSLVESVFIAYRSAKYVLLKNTALSVVKLIFPIFLLAFNAYGIFISVGIGNIIALLLSIGLLIYSFNYEPRLSLDIPVVRKMGSYSFANYIASFTASIPLKIMPVVIANYIGINQSGYFYIDMMIISALLIIPTAFSRSLLAEGSHNEKEINIHLRKTITSTLFLLVPAILAIVFLGDKILLAFGKKFSSEGFVLLQLFAFSTIFTAINIILGALLNVKKKLRIIMFMCTIGPIILLTLTYFLISKGLTGIGLAWLFGEAIISLIYCVIAFRK